MISVYSVYKDVLDDVNKEENGAFGFDQFTRVCNKALLFIHAKVMEYIQSGTEAKEVQMSKDVASYFISKKTLEFDNGEFKKPEDYAYYDNLRAAYYNADTMERIRELNELLCNDDDPTINKGKIKSELEKLKLCKSFIDCQILRHDQISHRLRSYIPNKRPTQGKPIAEQYGQTFKIYPCDSGNVELLYYRLPKECKLVGKENPSTLEFEFDATNSIDIDLPLTAKNSLVNAICTKWSVFVREQELFQLQQAQKQRLSEIN